MRPFILNADDYALDPAVDGAIERLACQGVVTATSAMVLSPFWKEASRRLRDMPVDAGLHLDLTSRFAPAAFPTQPLPRLMLAAFTRRLDPESLRQTIHSQLDGFESLLARPPRFIDGHHHVHQLPMVREALIDVLKAHYGDEASSVALRSCLPQRWRGAKAAIIAAAGARGLKSLADRSGNRINTDFIGVYDFARKPDAPALWRKWLNDMVGEQPLAMCHVALSRTPATDDDIWPARIGEYAWLSSEAFRDLCQELSVAPARWPKPH